MSETKTMMSRDRLRDAHLRRMAEPEPLRELRRQAERIESERRQASRRLFDDFEADRLRRQIRDAGEAPYR